MSTKKFTTEKIGICLQRNREKKGITQKEMADKCGLSKNYISAIERGIHKANIQTLLNYCELLDMTPNEILNYEDTEIIPSLIHKLNKMNGYQQQRVLDLLEIVEEI